MPNGIGSSKLKIADGKLNRDERCSAFMMQPFLCT
jgi:hypothetical protein